MSAFSFFKTMAFFFGVFFFWFCFFFFCLFVLFFGLVRTMTQITTVAMGEVGTVPQGRARETYHTALESSSGLAMPPDST